MNYIVLDLEWNQPVSKNISVYKKIGDRLKFEIIQIGAVKMNENYEIVDEFNVFVKPKYYRKMHSKVKKLTGIDFNKVDGMCFDCAVHKFKKWCGDNFVFLIWGNDDISVLNEHLKFINLSTEWTKKYYNLQFIAANELNLKNMQNSLKTVLDLMEISVEESLHNALNDAYYTALIATKLDINKGIENYKKLCIPRVSEDDYQLLNYGNFKTRAEALQNEKICKIKCPVCHKPAKTVLKYTKSNTEKYISLVKCKEHGKFIVKLRIKKSEQGLYKVNRIIIKGEENSETEITEKIKNYRKRNNKRHKRNKTTGGNL